eukprot:scaffold2083_cov419-Prasinococcus_capsulatus_cf.AAC.12
MAWLLARYEVTLTDAARVRSPRTPQAGGEGAGGRGGDGCSAHPCAGVCSRRRDAYRADSDEGGSCASRPSSKPSRGAPPQPRRAQQACGWGTSWVWGRPTGGQAASALRSTGPVLVSVPSTTPPGGEHPSPRMVASRPLQTKARTCTASDAPCQPRRGPRRVAPSAAVRHQSDRCLMGCDGGLVAGGSARRLTLSPSPVHVVEGDRNAAPAPAHAWASS